MWIVAANPKIPLTAHPHVIAHIISTGIDAGNNIFAASPISPNRHRIANGGDIHVHENTWPGLFGIISAMQALVAFMYGMVIIFILVVTVMTGSKILLAEQKELGIYKAIGFRTDRLRLTFALRFGIAAVAGAVVGTSLAAAFTDSLVSSVMKLAGISNFSSAPPVGSILLPAGIVILLFMGFAYLAAGRIRRVNLTVLISEG